MHFSINKTTLLEALTIVEPALSQKTIIESLKGILIKVQENKIIFSTSKQDIAITYTLESDFKIYKQGSCLVPGYYAITIIKKTYDNEIEIIKDNNTILLKTPTSKISLVEYDITSYPEILYSTNNTLPINLSKQTLDDAFFQTKMAVSNSNEAPILRGINFHCSNNVLRVASTDARRLALAKFNLDEEYQFDFTIAKNLVQIILKILDHTEDNNIEIYPVGNQIIIKNEKIIIKSRLIEKEYPAIEALIPTNIRFRVELKSDLLRVILEKITLLSEKDYANVVANFDDEFVYLKSYFRDLGMLEEKCKIHNITGSPFTISVDPNFVNNALVCLQAETIVIEFTDEISAFVIKSVDNDNNLQVLTPLRLT